MSTRTNPSYVKFTVRGENANVTISVKWREFPDLHDYHDGNWLISDITIMVPGFKGSFDFCLDAPALAGFLQELNQMKATVSGSASFTPIEPSISLVGEMTNMRQIRWKGIAQYPLGYGSELDFEFESDQSYLPEVISELENVLSLFPVRRQAGESNRS